MSDANPPASPAAPSTSLIRTDGPALPAYREERVATQIQEWLATGVMAGGAVPIAMFLQAWLEFTGFSTPVGMTIAMLVAFAIRILAVPVVKYIPIPFTVSDRTPIVWRAKSDRRIFAYVRMMERSLLANARAWRDDGRMAELTALQDGLKKNLLEYRRETASLHRLQRRALKYKGNPPAEMTKDLEEVTQRRADADTKVTEALTKYDVLAGKYETKRESEPISAEVKEQLDKLDEDELGQKIDALGKKPDEPKPNT